MYLWGIAARNTNIHSYSNLIRKMTQGLHKIYASLPICFESSLHIFFTTYHNINAVPIAVTLHILGNKEKVYACSEEMSLNFYSIFTNNSLNWRLWHPWILRNSCSDQPSDSIEGVRDMMESITQILFRALFWYCTGNKKNKEMLVTLCDWAEEKSGKQNSGKNWPIGKGFSQG